MDTPSLLHLDDDTLRQVCFRADIGGLRQLVQSNKRVRMLCSDILNLRYRALAYALIEKARISLFFRVEGIPGDFEITASWEGDVGPWDKALKLQVVECTVIYRDDISKEVYGLLQRLLERDRSLLTKIDWGYSLEIVDMEDRGFNSGFYIAEGRTLYSIEALVEWLVGILSRGGNIIVEKYMNIDERMVAPSSEGEIYTRAEEIEYILLKSE